MLVVDVWMLVDPSRLRVSAGSPDRRSVIATNDAHVRLAYWRSSLRADWSRAAAGPAASSAQSTVSTATLWIFPRTKYLPRRLWDGLPARASDHAFDRKTERGEIVGRDCSGEGGAPWLESVGWLPSGPQRWLSPASGSEASWAPRDRATRRRSGPCTVMSTGASSGG